MISVGTEALKALQLINGGAVIAILAYLGELSDGPKLAVASRTSVGCFVFGLATATVAFLFVYFTQFTLLNEFFGAKAKVWTHMRWLWLAVIAAVLSVIAFGCGSFLAIRALTA